MSAVTALILIGHSHPHHGGNRHFAEISLEEGSRPALSLRWMAPILKSRPVVFRKFTMIPTLENMLDDAVLMIAYAVCKDPKIFSKVNEITKNASLKSHRLTMYSDFTTGQRTELYAEAKLIDNLPKVTWCLFKNSELKRTMSQLSEYSFETEVICSA